MTTEANLNSSPLRLGSPTIRTANTFQTELADRLDESGNVQIDGAAVERIDTAALQLLAAFVRDLESEGRTVQWLECSQALRRAVHASGLGGALHLAGESV